MTAPFTPPFRLLSSHEGAEVMDVDGWIVSPILSPHKAEWLRDQLNAARLSQPSAPGVDAEKAAEEIGRMIDSHQLTGPHRPDKPVRLRMIANAVLAAAPKPTEHSGGEEYETVEEANAAGIFCGTLANGDTFGDEDDESLDLEGRRVSPTTPPSGDERAAFEKFAADEGYNIESDAELVYAYPTVRLLWRAWLARAKHTSGPHSPTPGLRELSDAERMVLGERLLSAAGARDDPYHGLDEENCWRLLGLLAETTMRRLTAAEPKAREGKDG